MSSFLNEVLDITNNSATTIYNNQLDMVKRIIMQIASEGLSRVTIELRESAFSAIEDWLRNEGFIISAESGNYLTVSW